MLRIHTNSEASCPISRSSDTTSASAPARLPSVIIAAMFLILALGPVGSTRAEERDRDISQRILGYWKGHGQVRGFFEGGRFSLVYQGKTSSEGSWHINGDKLIVKIVFERETMLMVDEIVEVTNSTMKLKDGENRYTYTKLSSKP